MKTIDTLGLIEHHLQGLSGALFFQAPTDLLRRLPALIVEQSAPTHFSDNLDNPSISAVATVTLNALAERRVDAQQLCADAFSRLFDGVHEVTELGWVSRCTEVQQPHLVQHKYEASRLFQYTAAVQVVFRQSPKAG